MPESKKLFKVEVSFTYYAMAEDELDAESFAVEAAENEQMEFISRPVAHRDEILPEGWDPTTLVYHDGEISNELTLKKCLDVLPEREKDEP